MSRKDLSQLAAFSAMVLWLFASALAYLSLFEFSPGLTMAWLVCVLFSAPRIGLFVYWMLEE
jgi:hypothetical protein